MSAPKKIYESISHRRYVNPPNSDGGLYMLLTRRQFERLFPKYKWGDHVHSKGGITEIVYYDKDNRIVAEGVAFCNGVDNFNKKLGRLIAGGRASKELNGQFKSFEIHAFRG